MNDTETKLAAAPSPPATYTLRQWARYVLALGTWGFGPLAAQLASCGVSRSAPSRSLRWWLCAWAACATPR